MSVLFRNSQKVVSVIPDSVVALGELVLEEEGASGKEVSVLFDDDVGISELNERHLGRNGPTDVLAFPMGGVGKMSLHSEMLGDVVVSAERAVSYATERGLAVEDELSLYLVHGILHLLGYDDTDRQSRSKMKRREKELLGKAREREMTIGLK